MKRKKGETPVFVELLGGAALVYRPGTFEVVASQPSLDDALALAREQWPALGVRVVVSRGAWGLVLAHPPIGSLCE